MFCIYLRTNSDLCHLQHKLNGFYNRDEKCLLRGTDWVFKYSGLRFVFERLNKQQIQHKRSPSITEALFSLYSVLSIQQYQSGRTKVTAVSDCSLNTTVIYLRYILHDNRELFSKHPLFPATRMSELEHIHFACRQGKSRMTYIRERSVSYPTGTQPIGTHYWPSNDPCCGLNDFHRAGLFIEPACRERCVANTTSTEQLH